MAESAKVNSTPVSYYIKLLVCLIFMFLFNRIVPSWGGITPIGLSAIGIFIGLILMIVFDFGLIPSTCLAMFAIVHSGFMTGSELIGSTIGNSTVVQLFFMFSVCNSLIQTGAGEFLAKWMLSRKAIQGRPMLFLFVLMVVGWMCGPFMGTSGLILLYTIMDYVNKTLGYEEESDFNMMTRIGLQSACMIGMAFLPFKGITLAIFTSIAGALEAAGIQTNYAYYMLGSGIIGLLYCIGFLLCMRLIFRVDVSRLQNLDITRMEGMENLKITRPQIYSILFTIAAILYTIIGLILPAGAFKDYFSSIGLWLWAALMLGLMSLIRYQGQPVINPDKLMARIMWGVALATAAFTAVGGMLSNNDLGVKAWIAQTLSPIFGGMSFPVFILVVVAIATIVTNFFSNMATGLIIGSAVAPFCVEYCSSLGINGTFICLGLVSASMFAFLTMAAAGPAPLLLSQEPFVKKPGYIWTHGGPALIMGLIIIWLVSTAGAFIF